MKDFKGVLIGLKAQKARGSEGFSRIILKKEKKKIGTNLKESILMMFNKFKEPGKIPYVMRTRPR